ncbi:MAG: hypothetical protein PVH80_04660, partial [Anaerolineae bacterium]
ERPWRQPGVPSVPLDLPPHATLIAFQDERGREARVDLWLVEQEHASQGTSERPFATLRASAGLVPVRGMPRLGLAALSE